MPGEAEGMMNGRMGIREQRQPYNMYCSCVATLPGVGSGVRTPVYRSAHLLRKVGVAVTLLVTTPTTPTTPPSLHW